MRGAENETDMPDIAEAWLRFSETKWAEHALFRLSRDEPLAAWRVIASLIDRTEDARTLKMLGMGPLEELLSSNGAAVIREVEELAMREPKMRVALAATWRGTIADDVWMRVQALQGIGEKMRNT